MALNKQSNVYTLIYIIVLVVLVGASLAVTSMSLADRQKVNADADKMRQILAAVHIVPEKGQMQDTYNSVIRSTEVVNDKGETVPGAVAFDIDVAAQSKLPDAERQLPVYVADTEQGVKYILPVYGAGLWGPIWGYVAVDADGSTIYGAFFGHQGETPGLGAEIEKPAFSDQFDNKTLWKNGHFAPVAVVKKGLKPQGDEDYVDGVSGGTITSKGVSAMLHDCLTPYAAFLQKVKNQDGTLAAANNK